METTRTIRCDEVVQDVRTGLTDLEIMGKFGLSTRQLRAVLARLLRAGAISESEIRERAGSVTDPTNGIRVRQVPRNYTFFPIRVHTAGNPTLHGQVNDVTMRGVGLAGLSSRVGQVLKLLIRADEFADIEPFSFDARCHWGKKTRTTGQSRAGFEIINLSGNSMQELEKLIKVLTLGDIVHSAHNV